MLENRKKAPKMSKNGLVVHKVPLTGHLWYEQGTEDVLEYADDAAGALPVIGKKRRKGALIRQDVQKRRRYLEVIESRRNELERK